MKLNYLLCLHKLFLTYLLIQGHVVGGVEQKLSKTNSPNGGSNYNWARYRVDQFNGRWKNAGSLYGLVAVNDSSFAQVGDSDGTGLYIDYCSFVLVNNKYQFSIPDFASIKGIELNITLKSHSSALTDGQPTVEWVGLVQNGTMLDLPNANPFDLTNNPIAYTVGSSTEVEDDFSPSDVNADGFGSGIVVCNSKNTAQQPINPRMYSAFMTISFSWNVTATSCRRIIVDSSDESFILAVTGTGFLNLGNTSCVVGSMQYSTCRVMSAVLIQCTVPSMDFQSNKEYPVEISLDGETFTEVVYFSYEGPTSTSTSTSTRHLALILGLSIGLGSFLIILILAGILFIRKRRSQYSFEARTPPNFEELKWGDTKPKYRLTAAHNSILEDLNSLFMEIDGKFLLSIFQLSNACESDDVSKAYTLIYLANNQIEAMVGQCIALEAEETSSETNLFRANSLTPRLFAHVSFLVGLEYLYWTLGNFVDNIRLKHEGDVNSFRNSAEVDPSKIVKGEDISVNKLQLQLYCQRILVAILNSAEDVPVEIRAMCRDLANSMKKNFDPETYGKMAGNFVFLRFFCPTLLAPDQYGITDTCPNPTSQRQLILVAKVLQSLANGVPFGKKEDYMSPLNNFINENNSKIQDYYNGLTTVTPDMRKSDIKVPDVVKIDALAFLHAQLHAVRIRLPDDISPETLKKIDAILLIPPAERLETV